MKYVVIVTHSYDHRTTNDHTPRITKQAFLHLANAHDFIRSMNNEITTGKISIEIKRERV